MRRCLFVLLASPVIFFPADLLANCLSDSAITVSGQAAYVNKKPSVWRIKRKNPYTSDNMYSDLMGQVSNKCQLIENKLDADFSLYALTYYPYKSVGNFEKDDHRIRGLIDRLSLSYSMSDRIRLEAGKLRAQSGLFYLKSPASLMNNYYSGFKSTRIYDPAMKQVYPESSWGARLSSDSRDYSLSLTVAPKLTHIDKRYESSSNWSALERSNASERYLLTYTDYRLNDHTPAVSFMAGDSKSVAISDSFNYTPQFVINAEVAYHFNQQWRHLDNGNAEMVEHY
ncbi:MAG: hypothetical protein LBN41_06700, partial [Enterobacteriaceae bacterium]|nr:hypothetical protein [Enterobacteriaceae bacterium]